VEPLPERFKTYKNCKDIEPKGECTKNYVDKQTSGTKDLSASTAAKRISGRDEQLKKALKDAGG